mmetsp:Transcript_5650/g.7224  ORF Transcript_5650/g.7224 Transcript_5650/m.7224 type:complete len:112 (-) Transcript_5650:42-377(-)
MVEHALCVDKNHSNVLFFSREWVGPFEEVGFTPHPYPRGVSLGATTPVEAIVAKGAELFVPLLATITVAIGVIRRMRVKVTQKPTQQKRFARAKSSYNTHNRNLPSRWDLR